MRATTKLTLFSIFWLARLPPAPLKMRTISLRSAPAQIDYNDFYDEDEEEAREEEREKCVVVIGGSHGIPFSVASNMWGGDTIVQRLESKHGPAGEVKVLDVGGVAYDVTQPFASVEIDGTSRTVQLHLESKENTLTVQMSGSVAEVVIMSEKEHVLSKHMLEPPIVDTSSMILSPMPGKVSERIGERAIYQTKPNNPS